MKRCVIVCMAALLLAGCAARETYETVEDVWVQPVMAQPRQISVRLPDNALAPVLGDGSQQVYFSEEYEIVIETLSSGDLNATVETISGFSKDQLTLVETKQEDLNRYEFVWACMGETGERLGRAVILDDGDYHYCMTALRDADRAGNSQIVWNDVFGSFSLDQSSY